MPVNLHILSGHGYSRSRSFGLGDTATGLTAEANSVNMKLFQSVNSLYELIYSGVIERFPKLKVVLVENELSWIPFVLEQWDYYFKRHGARREGLAIRKLPSEYFHNQIYTTFFNDAVGGHILSWWGTRQLHVVQRLPARQLDLAQFSSSCRPRPRRSTGRVPRETCA